MSEEIRATEPSDYLAQIAEMLVESAEVPTDDSDIANEVATVQTVKNVLDYLASAWHDNGLKREQIASLERRLEDARNLNAAGQAEIERLNNQIQTWNVGARELQDKYIAAQQEIGALTEQLSAAKRTAKRWEDEAANSQARYEGMEAALRIVLELAGVGK